METNMTQATDEVKRIAVACNATITEGNLPNMAKIWETNGAKWQAEYQKMQMLEKPMTEEERLDEISMGGSVVAFPAVVALAVMGVGVYLYSLGVTQNPPFTIMSAKEMASFTPEDFHSMAQLGRYMMIGGGVALGVYAPFALRFWSNMGGGFDRFIKGVIERPVKDDSERFKLWTVIENLKGKDQDQYLWIRLSDAVAGNHKKLLELAKDS